MSDQSLPSSVQKYRISILRVMFLCLVPFLFFTTSWWERFLAVHETMEVIGSLLIIGGVIGRFWSILYSGGRKNVSVVQDGPYSICRHPLYLFSTMAVIGLGLHLGSLIVTFVMGGLAFLILMLTAKSEERFLLVEFGDDYRDYMARVPRIVPDLALFHTPQTVTFSTSVLRRNAADAMVFLSFLPLAEVVEYLHESGIIQPIALF